MAENKRMQTGGAAASQAGLPGRVKVKKEPDDDPQNQHYHKFDIQFKGSDDNNYEINCTEPQTVLEAIKSCEKYRELGWSDDKIKIQRRTGKDENTIATHFPCTCLEDDDTLIVSKTEDAVEARPIGPVEAILPRDEYSILYIYKAGGKNTRTKKILQNNKNKQFKFLCVYGKKDFTVKEALERDGRFEESDKFKLSDYTDEERVIRITDKMNSVNGRKFKIERPREKGTKKPKDSGAQQTGETGSTSATELQETVSDKTPGPSGDAHQTVDTTELESLVERSGFRVEDVNLQEIMKKLREQFPALKKLMEDRFPGNKFQEALNLRKENFGKIQKDFSEFRTLRKLLERGESVCHLVVDSVYAGTGFVLVDNFIMTNAHLFKNCTEGNKLKEGTNVHVLFNFESPPPDAYYPMFEVEDSYIYFIEDELDYAVLKVSPEGGTWGPREEQPQKPSLPPGLLEYFEEMPKNGGACIIGHPGGKLKQIDLTCVIEPGKREQAVIDHTHSHKSFPFILYLINEIDKQGIQKIMMGGDRAERGMTYDTFMYHGSSGSPVFDAQGRVCALHTSGYVYEFQNTTESVIEFGQSLEIIVKHLVKTLNERKDQELLRRIREVSDRNPFIKEIFESV